MTGPGYGTRDDSFGDVEAPTGYVSLVTIPASVSFVSEDDWDVASQTARIYGVTPADVIGTYLVTWNSQGFVSVETFTDEASARDEFRCRQGRYEAWADEDNDDWDGVYVCPVTGHGYHTA